jgi:hypothetical protein
VSLQQQETCTQSIIKKQHTRETASNLKGIDSLLIPTVQLRAETGQLVAQEHHSALFSSKEIIFLRMSQQPKTRVSVVNIL